MKRWPLFSIIYPLHDLTLFFTKLYYLTVFWQALFIPTTHTCKPALLSAERSIPFAISTPLPYSLPPSLTSSSFLVCSHTCKRAVCCVLPTLLRLVFRGVILVGASRKIVTVRRGVRLICDWWVVDVE